MEGNAESLEFKVKSGNIVHALRMLAEQGIISPSVRLSYWSELWKARTFEDLQDITSRLARICEGRGEKTTG